MPKGIKGGFLDEFTQVCSLIIDSSEKNNGVWMSSKAERWGEKRLAIIRGLKQLGIIHRTPNSWNWYDVRNLDLLNSYLKKPPVSTYVEWMAFYKKIPQLIDGGSHLGIDKSLQILDREVMATSDPEEIYLFLAERFLRRFKFLRKKNAMERAQKH